MSEGRCHSASFPAPVSPGRADGLPSLQGGSRQPVRRGGLCRHRAQSKRPVVRVQ